MQFLQIIKTLVLSIIIYGSCRTTLAAASSSDVTQSFNDCTEKWRLANWKIVPFPDTSAQYLSYQFSISKGKKIALAFESKFPKGIYSSFVTYDEKENFLSSLLDIQFKVLPPLRNPFVVPHFISKERSTFVNWAVSENLKEANGKGVFTLPYSKDSDSVVDIWFRVYNEIDLTPVQHPKITAYEFDGNRLVAANCPPLKEKEYSIATEPFIKIFPYIRQPAANVEAKVPMPSETGAIHFFFPDSSSLGGNPHVRYAAARLPSLAHRNPLIRMRQKSKGIIQNIGEVSILKFKIPTSPDPGHAPDSITGKEDVRYWSICLSDADTRTSDCLFLSKTRIMKNKKTGEPYAVLVVAPLGNNDQIKKIAEARGYNFLDRASTIVPILFYRQMLARSDFKGNIDKIKPLPIEVVRENKDAIPYYAEKYIGEYAPTGRHCHLEDFLRNSCEMETLFAGLEKNIPKL